MTFTPRETEGAARCGACEARLSALPFTERPLGGAWKRIGGRERVEVQRIWEGFPPMSNFPEREDSCIAIRCRPLHGGKQWWTSLCEFVKRFEAEPGETGRDQ